jgi:hypothetical protein
LFSQPVTKDEAKQLIRRYWDVSRLPTKFSIFSFDRLLTYTARPEDGKSFDGVSMLPFTVEKAT